MKFLSIALYIAVVASYSDVMGIPTSNKRPHGAPIIVGCLANDTLTSKLGPAVANISKMEDRSESLADPTSKALPPIVISGIGFKSSVTLAGFNGLPSNTFVSKVTAVKDANGFTLTWKINIANPSIISICDKNELTVVTKSADTTILDGLSANEDTWTLQVSADVSQVPLITRSLTNLKLIVDIPALGV
ncbi:hypothetical protein FBU30_004443 [Linnemannia zychae]|nr:hypothetical protein FBU30_004443 [Linnemannia zychae]